jgi:hypothetical protein
MNDALSFSDLPGEVFIASLFSGAWFSISGRTITGELLKSVSTNLEVAVGFNSFSSISFI